MPLNASIALGFTAEIYAWHDGQVLKLFNRGVSRHSVEYEAELTQIVHATGLPVPAVGEIVEIDGRFGLEYERVDGISMLQDLTQKPWMFATFGRQLAQLQADMHKHQVPELPSLGMRLTRKINQAEKLPENVRQAALKALESLPEDDKLCHGDFHPGNILLTSRGPVIIDWLDAARGYPLADIAHSTLIIGGGPIPPGTPFAWLIKIIRRGFYRTYLSCYFRLNPFNRQQLSKWIPVVAAARLEENVRLDEDRLLSIAQTIIGIE